MKFYRKKLGGTGTVELAPALFILLIVILIPCLMIIHMGLAYACGWYANHLATREAACAGYLNAQTAADNATLVWSQSGLGKFVHAPPPTNTLIDVPPTPDPTTGYQEVTVTTTVKVLPLFQLPFVDSAPVTFQYSATRPFEERDQN
jgi:hypothetical protein